MEEYKLTRISRTLKRSGSSNQDQPRFMERAQGQEEPKRVKVILEKRCGSQNGKPTCVTCGKNHYCECLLATRSCYGCGKEGRKVRDCPHIASRGRVIKLLLTF